MHSSSFALLFIHFFISISSSTLFFYIALKKISVCIRKPILLLRHVYPSRHLLVVCYPNPVFSLLCDFVDEQREKEE
jgi:hypothetical protein